MKDLETVAPHITLPATIRVLSLKDITNFSPVGRDAKKAIDLAVEEIAAHGFLGGATIEVVTRDTKIDAELARTFTEEAIADGSYSAILGPAGSAEAVAMSPLVQAAGLPTIYMQCGSAGVIVGDCTFRLTAPADTYFSVVMDHLRAVGARTAAVLAAPQNPTLAALASETVPRLARDYHVDLVSTDDVDAEVDDFSDLARDVAVAGPDAVFILLWSRQIPVAVRQLREAGFHGLIVGMSAMGANLNDAGEHARGAIWPTDFSVDMPHDSTRSFVKAYEDRYGERPSAYAAQGYDSMWFLARAIRLSGSAAPAAVKLALLQIASAGFDGAMGRLSFEGTDLRVDGALATWDSQGETVMV